jgi:hypothetical protein
MSRKTRLAAAALAAPALAAALAAPALAGEPCTVCDDPTWPEIASPAPATTLRPGTEKPAILSDPTAPAMAQAAPAARLVPHEAEGALFDPAIGEEPAVHFAVVPGAPSTAVAAR